MLDLDALMATMKARRDDPLDRFRKATGSRIEPETAATIEQAADAEIADAIRFATESPAPDPAMALKGSF